MPRRQALSLTLCAAVIAVGCLPLEERSGPEEIRRALPTAQSLRVNLPEDNAQQFSLGQIADTYIWTRAITRGFNAGAAWVLIAVHVVVQFPPTTVTGNTYVWGPHSRALDPAEWMLTVVDNGDGSYAWELSGRSKVDPGPGFLPLITGLAIPGAEPHRGSGTFSIDFDNVHSVDPIDNPFARGAVDVEYDLENRDGTAATLGIHIDTVDDLGEPVTADYSYAEHQDGAGDFVFSIRADVDREGTEADARIRARWRADGAGRSDVSATGGDLGSHSITFSQCWDVQFRSVYDDRHDPAGDPAACAFETGDLPDA